MSAHSCAAGFVYISVNQSGPELFRIRKIPKIPTESRQIRVGSSFGKMFVGRDSFGNFAVGRSGNPESELTLIKNEIFATVLVVLQLQLLLKIHQTGVIPHVSDAFAACVDVGEQN